MKKPETTGEKQGVDTRFKKGHSGNPCGRPKGAKHKTTLAAQNLLDGESEALTRKAIEMALDGDKVALRLCLERIVPPAKERPFKIKIPTSRTINGINKSMDAVLSALAAGELLPAEANAVLNILREKRLAIEAIDIEKRLSELEKRYEKSNKKN